MAGVGLVTAVVLGALAVGVAVKAGQSLDADDISIAKEVKFNYSEKATKFCDIFTLLLSVCTVNF